MSEKRELWIKHRPTTFDDVVGQDEAVKMLKTFLRNKRLPHAILLTGQSGAGKSTLAHIVANELGCHGIDKTVINCAAVEKPIEVIRSLQDQVKLRSTSSNRVWIMEELQSWSKSGFAQQAMLLMLESAYKATQQSYIIACTTEPEKIKEAVRNRCKKIEVKPLSADDLKLLLNCIADREGRELPDLVVDAITDIAGGSAREAVNQLDSALAAGDDEESMLAVIPNVKANSKVWDLLKALFYTKPKWPDIVAIIETITHNEREGFRHAVLKMAATEMRKGTKNATRAFLVAETFRSTWEHCLESGLEEACWEICRQYSK